MRTPFESFLLSMLVDPRFNDGSYSESEDILRLSRNDLRNELLMSKELYPYDADTPPSTYSRSYGNLSYNIPIDNDGYPSKREYTGDEYPSRSFPVPGDLYGHPVNMSAEYSSASLSPFLKDHYVPAPISLRRASINLISKLSSERENLLFERIESGSRRDWWTDKNIGKGNDGPFNKVNYADYYDISIPGGADLNLSEVFIDASQTAKVIPDHDSYFINKQAADNLFRSINFIQRPKRKFLTIMDVLNFTTYKIKGRSVGYRPIYKRFDPIWMTHLYTIGDYDVILQVNYDRENLKNLNPERDPFRVSCSCPFWRWQGPEHWARKFLYIYSNPVGTASVPVIKDPMRKHGICKHVYALFKDIVAEYRSSQGYRQNRGRGKPIDEVVTSLDTRKLTPPTRQPTPIPSPPIPKKPRTPKPKVDLKNVDLKNLRGNPINFDESFSSLSLPEKRKKK